MSTETLLWRARRRLARFVKGPQSEPTGRVAFEPEDIPHLVEVWKRSNGGLVGSEWESYRDAHMRLPRWFRHDLDPWGPEYRAQQYRLWRLVVGTAREYDPALDELDAGWEESDPIRLPGFYQRRDSMAIASASDHFFATSMLLKHCGLKAGDRALEYGAGFGQTALALARLGVNVDTVDISPRFCAYILQQAEFFRVPLVPHLGRFGFHPRPGEHYQLIWFYESFHHCVEFQQVVPLLRSMLAPGGKVMLGGEPVVQTPNLAVPYPWGVRLHSEVAVMMRQTRWFELGFTEAFLREVFSRSGFIAARLDCEPSPFGRLYAFE